MWGVAYGAGPGPVACPAVELSDYLRALRNHAVGVVAIILVSTLAALAWSMTQPKVYAADSSALVEGNGDKTQAGTVAVAENTARERATSYLRIATSRPVAERVISDLGLDTSPEELVTHITADQTVDTPIIEIRAEASSPTRAKELADAWARSLKVEVDELENPEHLPNAQVPTLRVYESAVLPSTPVSPQPRRDGLLGFGVGCLLAVGYAAARSQLDRRLRVAADIEKQFGVAVVGAIPAVRNLERESAGAPAQSPDAGPVSKDYGTHLSDEAFRKLRTNLSYMDVDNPPRVIVVTSPRPGDGKSTVSVSLAAAVAASGQPVALVDADLRRPVVATMLGLVEGAGLTDVLVGSVELDDVAQTYAPVPGLTVLAAGSIPPNPSELLGSNALRTLFKDLSERAMVIVDAPPLLPVTDAAILSTATDGTIVVASYGRTLDSELGESLASIAAVNSRVLGVVFNKVPRRDSRGGYYGR